MGVILDPKMQEENPDKHNAYNNVYDKKNAYYKDEAIRQARDYIKEGVENTYGIVSMTTLPDDVDLNSEENIVDTEGETYNMQDIVFSAIKQNDTITEGFVKITEL